VARQQVTLALAQDSVLEYLPQETILFDGAQARNEFRVELGDGARYAGWEIVCLGRRASGERFQNGQYRQALAVRRNRQLLWHEASVLAGDDPLIDSAVGLGGASVFGGMIVAAGAAPTDLIDQARAILPREALRWGVTALPEIVSARFLGHSAEAGREWFEALRGIFRPWYAGCMAVRPRLWST
jgi:urease accessory protein